MSKVLWAVRTIYFVVSEVIGWAGIPDDLKGWASWLKPMESIFDNYVVRVSLIISGGLVITCPQWKQSILNAIGLNWKTQNRARPNWTHFDRFPLKYAACLWAGLRPSDQSLKDHNTQEILAELRLAVQHGKIRHPRGELFLRLTVFNWAKIQC